MPSFFARAAALALVAAASACGSIIQVPDQGVVVLGCNVPSYCFIDSAACSCNRADAQPKGKCTTPVVCKNEIDLSTCTCPSTIKVPIADVDMAGNFDLAPPPAMMSVGTQCIEVAQECVGRGVFCGGTGARCLAAGSTCSMSGGDPPQLVPTGSTGPALEPHCQFTDDVCCPNVDAGA
jgi:hypothetical protein